jgi:integrase
VVETDQGTAPKWGSSGTVTVPAFVAEAIGAHLQEFPARPDGFVFTAPDGGPLPYSNFYRRAWCKALEALGWGEWIGEGKARHFEPRYRIHDLRHTAVALSIAAGAHPKEIQELCRHRSVTTTLNEYGHLFPQLHERLAKRLDVAARAADAGQRRDHDGTAAVTALPVGTENTA